jgi:hypothetical protein
MDFGRNLSQAIVLPVLLQFGLGAAAQDAPRYSIKQNDPDTGSNIRSNRLTGQLPYDKSYAQLTDAQRVLFRSDYEVLAEADEPPFPEHGLGSVFDPISKAAQALRLDSGAPALSMVAYIDETGNASKVEVLSSPSPELTGFAARVAMKTKFKPAKCAGAPCAMGFPIRIRFIRSIR